MFARLAAFSFALAVTLAVTVEARTGHYARSPSHDVFSAATLGKRTFTGQTIAFSCYGGGGDCECPTDNNGDSGVLINVYPGFQCAYPNGACTWDDEVSLLISMQSASLIIVVRFSLALFKTSIRRTAHRRLHAARPVVAFAPKTTTTTPVS